ncbi:MAG: pre-peptidase C-terminal domain-containing protein [Tepidisphaeraceae bacterium]
MCAEHAAQQLADELALAAASGRNGADHALAWYTPARTETLAAGQSLADGSKLGESASFAVNAAGLPLLTSRADGVGTKIFMDFDGNGTNLPFGTDADDTTFSATEQATIYAAWRDMVSYFAPFNVNVTTVQPPTGGTNPKFAWQITSKSISGGYAYVNSLTNTGPTGYTDVSNGVSRHSGIAHEFGHIFGLQHQSEYDVLGTKTSEYTSGNGVRDAIIMGVDYATNVRTWEFGRNATSAGTLQADMEKIAATAATVSGGDGFRPDDVGNTTATALPLTGQRYAGFIERWADADVFRVDVATGGLWQFGATPTFESSVEAKLELLDSSGNLLFAKDDADQRNQSSNNVEFETMLAAGTYYVRVSSSGDYTELGEYELTATPLPDGYQTLDVGTAIYRPGNVSYDPATGVFTQMVGGSDIGSTSDEFRFTYQTLTGDGSISARVDSLDNTNASAKSGVMIRQSTANNSAFVSVTTRPDGTLELIRRATAGATASVIATVAASALPRWVQLIRAGSTYTASYSADGSAWTSFGSTTLTTAGSVLMGLATVSRNTRLAAYSTISNVTLAGTLGVAAPTYNALPAPTDLMATPAPGANTNVTLTWTDIAGETGYAIERSVDGINFTRLGATVAANVTTFTDTGLFGSMRWWYRVVALSGATGSTPSSVVSVINKPAAPAVPNSGYALPAISSTTAIYLNWTDVQGDQGYKVERSTDGTTYTLLGTTAANRNAYNDTAATQGASYRYRITPITNVGDGVAGSLLISAGTRWTTSALAISDRQSTSISLTWTDHSAETGYRIERSTTGTGSWSSVATLAANTTSWTNTGLTSLNEYYYRIIAVLPLAESLSSTIAYAATLPTTPAPAPWISADIGTVGGLGASGSTGTNTFKVLGGGTALGSSVDSFHFLYRPLAGDGSIVVQLATQKSNATDDNAEAGIMIRESLATGAVHLHQHRTEQHRHDRCRVPIHHRRQRDQRDGPVEACARLHAPDARRQRLHGRGERRRRHLDHAHHADNRDVGHGVRGHGGVGDRVEPAQLRDVHRRGHHGRHVHRADDPVRPDGRHDQRHHHRHHAEQRRHRRRRRGRAEVHVERRLPAGRRARPDVHRQRHERRQGQRDHVRRRGRVRDSNHRHRRHRPIRDGHAAHQRDCDDRDPARRAQPGHGAAGRDADLRGRGDRPVRQAADHAAAHDHLDGVGRSDHDGRRLHRAEPRWRHHDHGVERRRRDRRQRRRRDGHGYRHRAVHRVSRPIAEHARPAGRRVHAQRHAGQRLAAVELHADRHSHQSTRAHHA